MNKDLFLSILAMDSYNRGYNRGVNVPSEGRSGVGAPSVDFFEIGRKIGNAVITNQDISASAINTSFYAITYDVSAVEGLGVVSPLEESTSRVISYRGTDQKTINGDLFTTVPLFFGAPITPQTLLAINYYYAERGVLSPDGDVIATGHSLGGGLAGLVTSLLRADSMLFNNIGFGDAVAGLYSIVIGELVASDFEAQALGNLIGQSITTGVELQSYLESVVYRDGIVLPPTNAGISGFATTGEIAELTRTFGTIFNSGLLSGVNGDYDTNINPIDLDSNSGLGGLVQSIDLHSATLNVALQFVKAEGLTQWESAGEFLWSAYFNDDTFADLEFADAFDGEETNLNRTFVTQSAIAYSALDEGEMPFGNVGIRAMFDDAGDLGVIIDSNRTWEGMPDDLNDRLAQFLVKFAGVAALGDLEENLAAPEEDSRLTGVISQQVLQGAFSIITGFDYWSPGNYIDDFDRTAIVPIVDDALLQLRYTRPADNDERNSLRNWNINALGASATPALEDLLSSIAPDAGQIAAFTFVNGANAYFAELLPIGSRAADGRPGGPLPAGADPVGIRLITGSIEDNQIYGSANDEIIQGGAGSDMLAGGAGSNILVGGAGIDTIDYGNEQFFQGGSINIVLGENVGDLNPVDNQTIDVFVDRILSTSNDGSGEDSVFQFERIIAGVANDRLVVETWGESSNNWEFIDLGTRSFVLDSPESDVVLAGQALEDSVTIDLSNPTAQFISNDGGSGQINLRNVESAVGSKFNDTLRAVDRGYDQSGSNLIGGDGDDVIFGSNSANLLIGGKGEDEIHLGYGDFAIGGKGADKFYISTTLSDSAFLETNQNFILDFTPGEDQLFVNNVLFTGYQKQYSQTQMIAETDIPNDDFGKTYLALQTGASSFGLEFLQPKSSPLTFDDFYNSNPQGLLAFEDSGYRDVKVATGTNGSSEYGRIGFIDADLDFPDSADGTIGIALNERLDVFVGPLWAGGTDTSYFQNDVGDNSLNYIGDPNSGGLNLSLVFEDKAMGTPEPVTSNPQFLGYGADNSTYRLSEWRSNQLVTIQNQNNLPFSQNQTSIFSILPVTTSELVSDVQLNSTFSFEYGGLQVDLALDVSELQFAAFQGVLGKTDLSSSQSNDFGNALSLNLFGILPDTADLTTTLSGVAVAKFGSSGNDVFIGSSGNDVFIGNGGNDQLVTDLNNSSDVDLLVGGVGNDEYIIGGVFGLFDKVIIAERLDSNDNAGGNDILRINAASTEIIVVDGNSPNDLRILRPNVPNPRDPDAVSDGFGIINIVNQLGTDPDDWIEEIHFSDGVIWTRTQLVAAAVAADPVSVGTIDDVTIAEDNAVEFSVQDAFVDTYRRDFEYSAMLANGDPLPEWLSVVDGNVTGTPPSNFNGQLDIAVTGTIGAESVTTSFSLTISPENDAPEVDNPLDSFVLAENSIVDISVPLDTFVDVDGDVLTLSAAQANGDPLPAWLTFDGLHFAGTPPLNFIGALDITVTASDGSLNVTDNFSLVIEPSANNAPTVSLVLADRSADEDQAIDIIIPTGTFNDIDGDTLSLSASLLDGSVLPAWLMFDGTRFTGVPPQDFNGTIDLTVTASDGSLDVSDNFTLTIDPVNDAPVLSLMISDQTSLADAAINITVPTGTFTDVDGDVLTLSATLTDGSTLPAWLQFDGSNFTGAPPIGFIGGLDLRVTASDGLLSVSDDFILIIEAPTLGMGIPYPAITNIVEYDSFYMVGVSTNDAMFAASSSNNTNMVGLGGNDLLISESTNSSLQGRDGIDVLVIRNLDARVYGDAEGDQYGNVTGPGNSQSADYFVFDIADYVGPAWALNPSEIWATVKDYSDGNDKIAILNGSGGVNGFGDLTITQNGTSVDISTHSIPKIVLENTLLSDIDASDFIFGDGSNGTPTPSTGIPYPSITNIAEYDSFYMAGGSDNDAMFAASSSNNTNMVGLGGNDLLISESWNSSLQGREGTDVLVMRAGGIRAYGDAEGDQYGNVTGPGSTQSVDYFVFDIADYVGASYELDPLYVWADIKDYADGVDKIAILNGTGGANSFADLTITQNGTSVDISTPTIPRIVLENTAVANIDASDFIFGDSSTTSAQSASAPQNIFVDDYRRYLRNFRLQAPIEGRFREPDILYSEVPELSALRAGLNRESFSLSSRALTRDAAVDIFDHYDQLNKNPYKQPSSFAPSQMATTPDVVSKEVVSASSSAANNADALKIALMTQDMNMFGVTPAVTSMKMQDRSGMVMDYFAA